MSKRKPNVVIRNKTEPKIKVSKPNSFNPEKNSDLSVIDPNSKCWLQLLPNEVLELIFSFLSPRTLMALESLKCGRISDLTRKSRFADFSSCNDILPAEVQLFFTADVTRHIREINFTHLFLVNTSDLVKAIMRCKHLTSLTVIECGVTFEHMHRILMLCKQLRNLCWNVLITTNEDSSILELSELKIKKLYFHIDCPKSSEIGFQLLQSCPAVIEACFNFTSLMSPHIPLRTCQKNIVYKLHSYPVCPVNIILDDYFENMKSVYECIMATKWCSCSNPVGSLHMPMTSPYHQIIASPEEYPALALIPTKNSVQKLVLYFVNKLFLHQKMPDIKELIGKNLEVLAVKEMEVLSTESYDEEHLISMSQLVPSLISGCCNIQALILSPIHFQEPLKLEALHCLKGLKTLGLTSCAFRLNQPSQQNSFEELVKNVKDVEHFSLIDCENRCHARGPKDKELADISKWKRLKTLSIVNVHSLQFCNFLRGIATDCPNFKSLEIVNTYSSSESLISKNDSESVLINVPHIPNVMTLLVHSPQLMQLCINLDILWLNNRRFWESISSAKNLQSLCLTLTSRSSVYSKSVADAIEQLPLLHLFHLNSPSINEGLALRVTRIMKRHGVKYPKVEMTTLPSLSSNQTNCDSPHLYIA